MTANLFETQSRPEPKAKTAVLKNASRSVCRTLAEPFGTPDANGKYFYQRFAELAEKLPEADRDRLHELIARVPYDRMNELRKMLGRYVQADKFDQSDILESMQ